VPDQVTRDSIAGAVSAACKAGGLPGMQANARAPAGKPAVLFSAAFLGLGNVVSDLDRDAVRGIAADLGLAPLEKISVDHDCRIALAGGLSGRPGIVQIAGTGTSCYGRSAAGESWRAGGWGPLIDDEGSGYWLGIQAMRAVAQDYDGRGEPTLLTGLLSARLRLRDINELMNRLYAAGMVRSEIAALTPLVFEAAGQGDAVARRLIHTGCAAMADCVLVVARRLGMDQGPVELAVVGGMTKAGDALLDPLAGEVRARLTGCRILLAELPPAFGAGILALQCIGHSLEEPVLSAMRQAALRQNVPE